MNISECIDEIMLLHNAYAVARYDYRGHHVTELIDMYNQWHSMSSALFSRYISSQDTDLISFKNAEKGNSYRLASVFSELETPFQILIDKLKNSPYSKLERLIEEGEDIVKTIKYQNPPSGVFRTIPVYEIVNESVYHTWKNSCLRLIEVYFKCSNALEDFKTAILCFDKAHNAPKYMHNMIGILKSLIEVPADLHTVTQTEPTSPVSPVMVHVVQNQTQSQSVATNVFQESIKDELTGKQFKELMEIAKEESDPEKARSKVLEKVKSFGMDVLSNILANVITNPSVWGGL